MDEKRSGDKLQEENKNERQNAEPLDISDIQSVIPEIEEVEPIIESLKKEDRKKIVGAMLSLSVKRSWAGPYPPPEILKSYNNCFEGGAKAIFEHAKSQTDHRMNMERLVMTRELNQSGAGQYIAAIIALAFLAVSAYLVATGHEVSGTVIGSVDLIGLVTVFILGRKGIFKQNEQKRLDSKEVAKIDDAN